jgi:hypothetical protein
MWAKLKEDHETRNDAHVAQREFLVPPQQFLPVGLAAVQQRLSRSYQARGRDRISITVDRLPSRTAAPHGITGPELERLSGAVGFMTLYRRPPQRGLWLATTNKGSTRSFISNVWKRIGRLQAKYDLPAYSLTVLETRGGLHAHITFIGTEKVARRLEHASAFLGLVDIRQAPDPNGLVRIYLAKERTPQAGYGREHMFGGRLKGSHRLDGGGDRVRLSRALERDAIEAGYVDLWKHSNAKRSGEFRLERIGAGRDLVARSALVVSHAASARRLAFVLRLEHGAWQGRRRPAHDP